MCHVWYTGAAGDTSKTYICDREPLDEQPERVSLWKVCEVGGGCVVDNLLLLYQPVKRAFRAVRTA